MIVETKVVSLLEGANQTAGNREMIPVYHTVDKAVRSVEWGVVTEDIQLRVRSLVKLQDSVQLLTSNLIKNLKLTVFITHLPKQYTQVSFTDADNYDKQSLASPDQHEQATPP